MASELSPKYSQKFAGIAGGPRYVPEVSVSCTNIHRCVATYCSDELEVAIVRDRQLAPIVAGTMSDVRWISSAWYVSPLCRGVQMGLGSSARTGAGRLQASAGPNLASPRALRPRNFHFRRRGSLDPNDGVGTGEAGSRKRFFRAGFFCDPPLLKAKRTCRIPRPPDSSAQCTSSCLRCCVD